MDTSSRLSICGIAAGAAALLAACGSGGSSSSSLQNPFGGGVNAGGSISVPTLPGGIPGLGSTSATATGPGATIDACTAMSASAASQIAGGNVVKLSGTNAGGVSQCVYADQATGAGAVGLIENVPNLAGTAALQSAMNQAAHAGTSNAEPVSGLGDAALKEVEAHAATVAFSKGSTLVVVGVYGSSRDGASIETDIESLLHQIEGQI